MCGGADIPTTAFTFIYCFPRALHDTLGHSQAFPGPAYSLQYVCGFLIPYEQIRILQSPICTPGSLHIPFKVWARLLFTRLVQPSQTNTLRNRTSPREQALDTKSCQITLPWKGIFPGSHKTGQLGTMFSSGIAFFLFWLQTKSEVWSVPSSRLLTGGWEQFQLSKKTQLEAPEKVSAVFSGVFMASRRLALPASGAQAWKRTVWLSWPYVP